MIIDWFFKKSGIQKFRLIILWFLGLSILDVAREMFMETGITTFKLNGIHFIPVLTVYFILMLDTYFTEEDNVTLKKQLKK